MKFLLFVFMMFLSGISNATDYYVTNSGNNSNNGTSQSTPWQTLSKVETACNNGTIKAGDNVFFKKGDVFSEKFTMASIWGNHSNSGTASSPITFSSYGTGVKPVFQYPAGSTTAVRDRSIFWFVGVNYIVVDGLNFTDLVHPNNDKISPAYCGFAIYLGVSGEATANHCTIKNIDVSLLGMAISVVGDYNTVTTSTLTNFKDLVSTSGGDDDYGANPFTIMDGNNNNITNNYVSGGWAESMDFGYNGGFCEMYGACSNNRFMYNTVIDCNGLSEFGGSGSNLNNLYAYNKIVDCGAMYWVNASCQVGNIQFYNNTVVETNNSRFSLGSSNAGAGVVSAEAKNHINLDGYMFDYAGSQSASAVFTLKNNIIQILTPLKIAKTSQTKMSHDFNIAKFSGGSSFGVALNTHDVSTSAVIFTNTTGANAASWDLKPPPASPAIDAGTNVGIGADFIGNPVPTVPNAGILETPAGSGTLTVTTATGLIKCNGGTTTVTVTASGGTAPYTGTGTFTVAAGTFSYTVTDAAGTIKNTSVTIAQPTVITASTTVGTILIFGGNTTITVTATGGTSPYTYSMNGITFQSASSFSGILAGNYTITVKDAMGCTGVKTISITQPAAANPLSASSTQTAINCNGGNSTINITASGGTAPYTGTGTFSVGAGTYNYTITDAAGAIKNISVTITQPAAINASVSAPSVTTPSARTTATVTASGGTPAYTYNLDGGAFQSSNIFSNVAVGNHTVVLQDVKKCSRSLSFIVSVASSTFTASLISKTDVTCKGKGDGTITVKGSGGTAPYQFKKNNGSYTSNPLFTNVHSGTQTITGKDATGATSTFTVTILPSSIICSAKMLAGSEDKSETPEMAKTSGRSAVESKTSEFANIDGLKVIAYPNPSSSQFSLAVNGESEETVHITIMDIKGQKVFENQAAAHSKISFGSTFLSGVYFVKVIQGKTEQTIRVVKTR